MSLIEQTYTIGPEQFIYTPNDHLPEIDDDRNVVIHFSGGVESTLCAMLCVEKYGKDRVQLIANDTIYCKFPWGTNNSYDVAKILDLPIDYFHVDADFHRDHAVESLGEMGLSQTAKYNAEYVVIGFTGLYLEVVKDIVPIQHLGSKELRKHLLANPEKYMHAIHEFYVVTGDYLDFLTEFNFGSPDILEALEEYKKNIMLPLAPLTKASIIDLWHQLGFEEVLYQTRSCSEFPSGEHCGKCFNCQQRFDAFEFAGYEDPTDYLSDDIKAIRYKHRHYDNSLWELIGKQWKVGK